MLATRKEIQGLQDFTLVLDGWTDTSKRSLVAFLVMQHKKPSLLIDLVEMSGARHTADTFVDETIAILKRNRIDCALMGSIGTDSPTTIVAYRQKMEIRFPQVLTFGCYLHKVGLLIGDILGKQSLNIENTTYTSMKSQLIMSG